MQEVAGSSPASSTPSTPAALHVGANEFRTHFGYYLEKAVEGHEVLVSRRGRPSVRVTPVEPTFQLVAA
jgi:prevent-host-death family protein